MVNNRHLQTTAGRNRTNASPAVPPVGLPLLPCDWKGWLHFPLISDASQAGLSTCADLPLRDQVAASASRQGLRQEDKERGGGLKEEGKIYFFRLQVCSSHSCNERLEPLRNVKKSLSYNKSGIQDLKAPKTYSLINSSL